MTEYAPTIEGQFYPSDRFPTVHGTCRSCREDIFVPMRDGPCPTCQGRTVGLVRAIEKRQHCKRRRGSVPVVVRKAAKK